MKETVIIVLPLYNDLASLETLITRLETVLADNSRELSLLIVNDGSTENIKSPVSKSFTINILELYRNIGHQKAIVIGLAYIHHNLSCDKIIIMDSDGEDRPEDIPSLLKTAVENSGQIIFGRRKARQESAGFRFFYFFYKLLFYWLTGKKIAFGNFMLIPKDKLDKLVYNSEIWNHVSAGIMKSNLPFCSIPVNRGKRYAGNSKMGFTALVLHGLGAIAVFMEQVASRLLILSFILIVISTTAILTIVGIRYFTNLAIPGWTSTVLSSMLIILLQGFLLSLFTIFLFLSSQSHRKFIPAHHYKDYTADEETINHA